VEIDELAKLARQIEAAYGTKNEIDGRREWTVEQYVAGFVGDVGDLSKLVMAKCGYREAHDVDERIAHELSDCLWSILVIADKLQLDLASVYKRNMDALLHRITQ